MKFIKPLVFSTFIVFATLLFLDLFFNTDSKFSPTAFCGDHTSISQYDPNTTSHLLKNIETGDSIYTILKAESYSDSAIHKVTLHLKNKRQTPILQPGNSYNVLPGPDEESFTLMLQLSKYEILKVQLHSSVVFSEIIKNSFRSKFFIASISIKSSLFETLQEQGLPLSIAYELNNIFLWDIDFNTEIYKKDSVKFLYEMHYFSPDNYSLSRITAAQFNLHGKTITGFGFFNDSNKFGYYTAKGKSLRRAFLRSPLKYRRISSGFTYRRFHPILRIFRPHLGIDYAAPLGTPVLATSSGRVVMRGWDKKGGGNTIKIKHKNGYATTYMHLLRFSRNIKRGSTVRQGDVIAFVGSTGLSTGPHLDYRVRHNSKYMNPLKVPSKRQTSLSNSLLKKFSHYRERVSSYFNNESYQLNTISELIL